MSGSEQSPALEAQNVEKAAAAAMDCIDALASSLREIRSLANPQDPESLQIVQRARRRIARAASASTGHMWILPHLSRLRLGRPFVLGPERYPSAIHAAFEWCRDIAKSLEPAPEGMDPESARALCEALATPSGDPPFAIDDAAALVHLQAVDTVTPEDDFHAIAIEIGQEKDALLLGLGPHDGEIGGFDAGSAETALDLDPTDKKILRHLQKASGRLLTPVIATALSLNVKSIGNNLARMRRLGLIENRPRRGYVVTPLGRKTQV